MLFYTCEECGEQCHSEDIWIWCNHCNARHFQQQFNSWTSGNSIIDNFIQDTQLNALNHFQKLEWIPFELFTDVEYLSKGGYGKVYKATWKNGYIYKWDAGKKDWSRRGELLGDTKVVLKSLHNSEETIPSEFFDEIKHQKRSIDAKGGYKIIPCYGITKDPKNDDFMMVMRFAEEGSLRNYLNKKFPSLDWYQKLKILYRILEGLEYIHNVGLTHRDFHSGNIVLFDSEDSCITDFGLCKPINHDSSKDGKVFGVLPYVAPEVIGRHEYTQPADIYSFGILMNEMATGLPPYKDESHDIHLALKICQGLRPKVDANITPKLFIQLTKQCWDGKAENRPTSHNLKVQVGKWLGVFDSEEYEEFWSQVKKIEQEPPKSDPSKSTLSYTTHPQAVYTSRLLQLPNFKRDEHVSDSSLLDLKIPDI